MKAAALVRVSTEEQHQKGNSIPEQEERLEGYFKLMGINDFKIYYDEGYSGKDLNRPGITELLEDVPEKEYTLVVTTKLDRLSRNLFDILNIIKHLEQYDCNYASATEGFDTSTPAGRLVLHMLGMVAEFERERISERVRDNMMSIARNTNRVISRPCYGYDIKNGVMEVNVEESIIVKKMAQWTLEGLGSRAIAKRLNEMGIKTKSGGQWHSKIVRELLKRETLVGDFVYNRTYRKGTRTLTRPEEEWIRVEGHHDPILDRETFDKVQQVLDARKQVGKQINRDRYLLSGLVVCGHCGGKMSGRYYEKKRPHKTYRYYRYVCESYAKKGMCKFHWVHRDELESLVLDRIKELDQGASAHLKVVKHEKSDRSEIEMIQSRLKKLDQKMQKQIEAYEDDLISAHDLKKARERVEKERKQLEYTLEQEKKKVKKSDDVKVKEHAKKLMSDIFSVDRLQAKQAIRQLIHKIEVKEENVNIEWYSG